MFLFAIFVENICSLACLPVCLPLTGVVMAADLEAVMRSMMQDDGVQSGGSDNEPPLPPALSLKRCVCVCIGV